MNKKRLSVIGIAAMVACAQIDLQARRPSRKQTVTDGIYIGATTALKGVRLRLLRRSASTSGMTCQFLEDAGAYKRGSIIHIMPYELGNVVTHQIEADS